MKADDCHPDYLAKHGITVPRSRVNPHTNARKTVYNGKTYDSGLEANCRAELDKMQRAGLVTKIEEQVKFDLPGGLKYTPDFVVEYATGARRVIEAKGREMRDYVMRRKLFEAQYGPLDVVKHWRDLPQVGR